MASKRKPPKPPPKWARRRGAGEGPARLDPELAPLARGERARRADRRPRLRDPRLSALVPGVKNADARAVYDDRVATLRELVTEAGDDALDEALAEAAAMGLWRGRSLTGFDALAVDVLQLDAAEARTRAERGAAELDLPIGELSAESVAAWFRAEAALIDAGLRGKALVRRVDGAEQLELVLDGRTAAAALAAIGERQRTLGRDLSPRPPRRRD